MDSNELAGRIARRLFADDEATQHDMEVEYVGYDEDAMAYDDDSVYEVCDCEEASWHVYDPSGRKFRAGNYFGINLSKLWNYLHEDDDGDFYKGRSLNEYLLDQLGYADFVKLLKNHMTLDSLKVIVADYGYDPDDIVNWRDAENAMRKMLEDNDLSFLSDMPDEVMFDLADKASCSIVDDQISDWLDQYGFDDCDWLYLKDGYDYTDVGYREHKFVVYDSREFTSDEIYRMFNYSPVTCRICIDGDEYFAEEGLSGMYSYDKDEIIEYMKKQLGDKYDDEIEEFLDDELPECL